MKKLILTAFGMMTLAVFTCTIVQAQGKTDKWSDDDYDSFDDNQVNPGVWSAVVHTDRVYIQFAGFHWSNGATFPTSELGALPTDKPGTFVVKREPGTVTFNGSFTNDRGHGTYIFQADEAFRSYLATEGFKDMTEELMLHLFFTNINKQYLGYMKENGYNGISMSELKDLAYQNVNQKIMTGYLELFKKENYGKVSLDRIVELREHGVSPSFISSFHQMGYKTISLELAQELKDHGVNPDFVAEMKKLGGKDLSLEEAIELRDHGVSTEFVQGFRELGYTDVSLSKAVELRDHGVSIEFIREFQRLGYKDISPDQAQELRDHGVDPSFVSRFKGLGFGEISLNKAVELRDHGVTPDYIKKLQDKGFKNMSLDEYIRMRDVGM